MLIPPANCSAPDVWGGITLTLTVTTNGTQFPRFAFFTFQNVEIWRFFDTYSKQRGRRRHRLDVRQRRDALHPPFLRTRHIHFAARQRHPVGLDGEYAVTLKATIFSGSSLFPPAPRADLMNDYSADDSR
ncbi:hypothetical protein EDB89DRAFT_1290997 [Lactarius sanguifluus]|nr:hypothetical protein EDB89DRAFT_1290997 [Lactarius sanguifluus]